MRASLIIVAIVALAACSPGGAASPGASTGGTSGGNATPRPTSGASHSKATPRPSGGPGVTFHAAPELEALIPAGIPGANRAVESIAGTGFADDSKHEAGLRCRWYETRGLRCRDQAQLDKVLAALGKTRADVLIAVSYAKDGAGAEVQATQVAGVSGAALRDAVMQVLKAEHTAASPLNVENKNVGGKDAQMITYRSAWPLGKVRFFIASGDVLFDIRKTDEAGAAAIAGGL